MIVWRFGLRPVMVALALRAFDVRGSFQEAGRMVEMAVMVVVSFCRLTGH